MLTAEQIALRQEGVGGSDIPVILGLLEKFGRTREQLVLEKAGLAVPEEPPAMKVFFGHAMEPAIIHWLQITHQWTIDASDTLYHPLHPQLLCHPDGIIAPRPGQGDGPGVLECKNSRFQAKTGPALYHEAQVRWNMGVAGLSWGVLAVLVGGCEVVETEYQHDEAMFQEMVKAANGFWAEVEALRRQHPPVEEGET